MICNCIMGGTEACKKCPRHIEYFGTPKNIPMKYDTIWTDGEGVTYEPVRLGKWIPHPTEREWDICDNCGIGCKRREYGLNEDGREWVTEYGYRYCPNCGAKMEMEV